MSDQLYKMVRVACCGDEELDAVALCLEAISHIPSPAARVRAAEYVAERAKHPLLPMPGSIRNDTSKTVSE